VSGKLWHFIFNFPRVILMNNEPIQFLAADRLALLTYSMPHPENGAQHPSVLLAGPYPLHLCPSSHLYFLLEDKV
jgi:hypothetical protein